MSSYKNIILLGPPASGKGTQGKRLANLLKLPVLGTGNLLRRAIEDQTELGTEASKYLDKGLYVPDSLIESLVAEWASAHSEGWIFDGFPRTQAQAEFITDCDSISSPDLIVAIDVPQEELERRVVSRRQCTKCDVVTSTFVHDTEDCPECDGKLVARNDDALDSFRVRYAQYSKLTAPLFDHYRASGKLVELDGTLKPDDVFQSLLGKLEISEPTA